MDDFSPAAVAASIVRTIRGSLTVAGRARRTEVVIYWAAALAIRLAGWPLIGASLPRHIALETTRVLGLLLIAPGVALAARRLHDRNLTGWWALLLVAVAGWAEWPRDEAALRSLRDHPGADWTALIPAVLSAALLIVLMLPGTEGANRFGADPRGRTAGTLPPPDRFR